MIDNYRQLLHKTILNTSGPKRRNKKADKKKPVKKADPSVPLPETPFTLEMELQHNLIRGLLRVSRTWNKVPITKLSVFVVTRDLFLVLQLNLTRKMHIVQWIQLVVLM